MNNLNFLNYSQVFELFKYLKIFETFRIILKFSNIFFNNSNFLSLLLSVKEKLKNWKLIRIFSIQIEQFDKLQIIWKDLNYKKSYEHDSHTPSSFQMNNNFCVNKINNHLLECFKVVRISLQAIKIFYFTILMFVWKFITFKTVVMQKYIFF